MDVAKVNRVQKLVTAFFKYSIDFLVPNQKKVLLIFIVDNRKRKTFSIYVKIKDEKSKA
jgi:hypothetical protein